MQPQSNQFIGLISGTSADGIDAIAVSFTGDENRIEAFDTYPYPDALSDRLQPLLDTEQNLNLQTLGTLDASIADAFADAALAIAGQAGWAIEDISAIGSHGQTIYHGPDANPPFSLQLGDPNHIAYRTGIPVVGDFRRMDLAAGGQAAPLAPLIHDALFREFGISNNVRQAVVNIGGIANITWLPATAAEAVLGFDSGPGNCLMNAWCRLHLHQPFDTSGQWAADGQSQPGLLAALMQDEYLHRPPPKSTGREYFTLQWLQQRYPELADLAPADVQATLLQLTAISIKRSIAACGEPERVIVCGGGVHNQALMHELGEQLAPAMVISSSELGVSADAMEALLFAWLAQQRLDHQLIDTCSVTGAREPVLLGSVFRSK